MEIGDPNEQPEIVILPREDPVLMARQIYTQIQTHFWRPS